MRTTIFSLSIILPICLNNGGAIAQTTKTIGSGGDYATLHAALTMLLPSVTAMGT